jgi:phosphoribosyl-ATP pyrophosphohydrolase
LQATNTPQLPLPAAGGKPSWTARLLANPELLCSKVREEAGELCQTLEAGEGKERAASEAADLFYHAMVLLNAQVGGPGKSAVGGVRGWHELMASLKLPAQNELSWSREQAWRARSCQLPTAHMCTCAACPPACRVWGWRR